jgi:MraZ protein
MESLTGEYRITLDDKGRLSLPVRLRNALADSALKLTHGEDDCLWLYPIEEWRALVKTIMDTTSPFSARNRALRRKIIGPSIDVELDKAGRIPVAQSLREFGGLSKDCVVLGQIDYIEIWAEERYRSYMDAHEEEFRQGSEELGSLLMANKDLSRQ